ncbi:AMP-dependent synthetase/ligase [Pandoraea sputorum]|uniref:AMP-dependent synthetase/ligase n=1 Tax=Pandoraea sputorum TaxID=93222 RepID=UPI001240E2AD|nr:AMP-binding protein [Pandoraea sputorum]BET10541.1 AMP-binding protein [Pandoraea sputorum]VVD93929.1 long-chain fatty acid--CoA ligase [Pandoraea sputorum]VVE77134.1 long-chain fatty acid--CoA ligase [Pandoraea sputorum]
MQERTTFPRLLLAHAATRGARTAYREKDLGIWQSWSWQEAAHEVRMLACALAAAGFKRGDNLAIVGNNRVRLYWAMTAAQALGGVAVPLYQDAVAAEMAHVLEDAEIDFVVAEDQEQVDKLLELRERVPHLSHIIYEDPRGLRNYDAVGLQSYASALEQGRTFNAQHPRYFDDAVAAVDPDDTATILYTSGTTGKPKGVCHSHAGLIGAAYHGSTFDRLGPGDEVLSYLPMAWVGDHLFSYAQALVAGFTVNCPESPDTISTDMREIGPTYYFAPPRVYENVLTQVMIRMEDANRLKRKMFAHFMDVANRCGAAVLDRRPVSWLDRLQYAVGNLCVYGPLRNTLGMSRIRTAYTAGEAIGPDLFRFYRAIGINLKQFYGQTETCAYVCLQPDRQVRFDSVGPVAPGMEIKIGDNGEVLVRGVGLLKEYYKRPDATREALDEGGYFRTGDAGIIDADGHLRIIDRAKDVGKLACGALFAPKYIENKLKFFSYIKEAVAFGDGRDGVCAFINIDMDAVGNWAERKNLAYAGYIDLASNPLVAELILGCIEQVNADLAKESAFAAAQIQRFVILHKELDPDDDELTRTRKVRRAFIAQKYDVLIDAFYTGKATQFIETRVKFEDGREGSVSATLTIHPARVVGVRAPVDDPAPAKLRCAA